MTKLLTLPDLRLRQKSLPVTFFDENLQHLCQTLEAAMLAGPGGVGIAAPQLGVLQRVIVVDCTLGLRPCKNHGRQRSGIRDTRSDIPTRDDVSKAKQAV